ncbi:MAG: hypothetical protein QM778_00960 [Myxococcales bacterium]
MAWRLVLSLEPFKNRGSRAPDPVRPTGAIPAYSASARLRRWVPWWSLVSACVLLGLFTLAWPFSVDDAFILARYARRLSAGQGYTFSDGPPTDGVTGPLWLLPLWLGARLGLHPLSVGKVLGGAAALVAVGRVVARAQVRALGRVHAPLTAAFCLTSVPLVIWPVAGLETGLATWLVTEIALGITRSPAPRIRWVGICVGLLAWLRPELAFFALVALGSLAVRAPKLAWRAWVIAGAFAIAVLAFRKLTFGHFLPMSGAAKPPELRHGIEYMRGPLLRPETGLAIAVFVVALRVTRGQRWFEFPLLLALSFHVLCVVLAGGDWMPGFRLLCPLVPVFAWCLARAFVAIWLKHRSLFWCLLVPLLTLRGLVVASELTTARAAGITRERALPQLRELLHAQSGLIAAVDVGWLGEAYPGPILDLGGLTDPRIAYLRGGHVDKRIASPWLRAQGVTLFMLHSAQPPRLDEQGRVRWFQGFPVERRVLSMPWVAANYRVSERFAYQPAYHYVLLTPRASAP